jgi:hypothetical protein
MSGTVNFSLQEREPRILGLGLEDIYEELKVKCIIVYSRLFVGWRGRQ